MSNEISSATLASIVVTLDKITNPSVQEKIEATVAAVEVLIPICESEYFKHTEETIEAVDGIWEEVRGIIYMEKLDAVQALDLTIKCTKLYKTTIKYRGVS